MWNNEFEAKSSLKRRNHNTQKAMKPGKWTDEWMNEWIYGSLGKFKRCIGREPQGFKNELTSEWMDGQMKERRMNEIMNEAAKESMNEWMKQWMTEIMNQWTNECMNEWMSDWTNEWSN